MPSKATRYGSALAIAASGAAAAAALWYAWRQRELYVYRSRRKALLLSVRPQPSVVQSTAPRGGSRHCNLVT